MKIKIKPILAAVILAASVSMAGCGKDKTASYNAYLYYINNDATGLTREGITCRGDSTQEQVLYLLKRLSGEQSGADRQPILPKDVTMSSPEIRDHQVYLYFDDKYADMKPSQEILCRGAIVKTLMQVEGVKGISFFVDSKPLTDEGGKKIGIMTDTSFSDDLGNVGDESYQMDLNLYFSNKKGDGLVRETRTVRSASNISTPKLVMRELLKGPKSKNARTTLPNSVVLNRISVMDGVCYVNLGSSFNDQDYNIGTEVVIYSIVNSLTELPGITSVQISIDGNSDLLYRNSMPLQIYYEKNSDLVNRQSQ